MFCDYFETPWFSLLKITPVQSPKFELSRMNGLVKNELLENECELDVSDFIQKWKQPKDFNSTRDIAAKAGTQSDT